MGVSVDSNLLVWWLEIAYSAGLGGDFLINMGEARLVVKHERSDDFQARRTEGEFHVFR
jgi:hypothetical protein